MRALPARSFVLAALGAVVITLAACPKGGLPGGGGGLGGGGLPDTGGGKMFQHEGSSVDPNTCGNYAVSDAGRKLKAFLTATARLDVESQKLVNVVGESCAIMGRELKMMPTELEGQPKDVCNAVIARMNDDMKVAFKAKAKLDIGYKPAVCSVDAHATAVAAAQCEGKAEADMKVTCHGTCDGTCNGKCKGSTGAGGKCNGECAGSCQGQCTGDTDVNASGQCEASADVDASLDVQCTEPELTVDASASAIIDPSKAENVVAAIKNGMPKILSVQARLKPLKGAVETWAKSATDLAKEGRTLAQSFQDQALCIAGQVAAVGEAVGRINANINVSVEVSVSASASAGVH